MVASNILEANSSRTNDEDVVISGMSGMFPLSNNIDEFEYNLYNKINMVNDDESRYEHTNPSIPKNCGKLPEISKFDATFFGVNGTQANFIDPQNRILIEEAYKAIIDAGINPFSLRGSNVGVYIGSSLTESATKLLFSSATCFGITGVSRSMFANRISYTFGLNGPSMLCDTACSSSIYALDMAFKAIKSGEIDAALIGGANLCLHPNVTLQFALLGVLSPSGTCRPFDAEANGYTRSETVSCIYLQRKSKAKRIYATVVSSATNCDGYKLEGITYPSSVVQERLLRQVYTKAEVDPNDLGYLEAHGTATIVGDPEECKAIDSAICSQRSDPLLIGSVKSNCGHAEPAGGMGQMVKALLALDNGVIPPNINFKSVKESIGALKSGRLKVVTSPTKLVHPYIGVNSFGFGGANAHVILKQYEKVKLNNEKKENDTLPRLVMWSDRTEENVANFLNDLEVRPLDNEFLALLHSVQSGTIKGMVFRGYSILNSADNKAKPVVLHKNILYDSDVKRPLVWVFGGMGSQWAGMGKSLMRIQIFKQSILRSHNTLKPSGLDLINIVCSDDPKMFNDIIHSFVGITAIQIALVDILKELGLRPDYLFGHSAGELGCSYADNCFTAEQTILASYYRGKVSSEMDKIKGSMAAVGLGYSEILPMLPDTIEVACHNSADSCTISGPCEDVARFVLQLKAKNIFAKEVPCSNIAYHSKYISHFGPSLLKYLKHIIPNPKLRSNKWISTSVAKNLWLADECKYSSPEYHTNNLLSSVLFEEAASAIPNNALTIELGPHALLQSILKSLITVGVHIGLTKRNSENGPLHLLNALGSLYINGTEISIEKLYPKIDFPVSRGTPSLSSRIRLDHKDTYYVFRQRELKAGSGELLFQIKLEDKFQYLMGHEIDGRVLIPATFYLECAWRTFASMRGVSDFESLAVEFTNVKFDRATTLTIGSSTELSVIIHGGTGQFEVSESKSLVVIGFITEITEKTMPNQIVSHTPTKCASLYKKGFYKELKLRGYHYNGDFQGVEMVLSDGSFGKIKWIRNWVSFMDCMLQISILGHDSRELALPTKLSMLRIYPKYHKSSFLNEDTIDVVSDSVHKSIISGGIEIIGLEASAVQRRRSPSDPVLERYQFIPHFPSPKHSVDNIARCCIQLALENQPKSKLEVVEIAAEQQSIEFIVSLKQAVENLPSITGNYTKVHKFKTECLKENELEGVTQLGSDGIYNTLCGNIVLVDRRSISTGVDDFVSTILDNMDRSGFLICKESANMLINEFQPIKGFAAIAYFPSDNHTYVMLKCENNNNLLANLVSLSISSSDTDFKWIEKLQQLCTESNNVILLSQKEKESGILGLVNCLRNEPDTKNIRCVFMDDKDAPPFDIKLPFFADQLKLGLAINIFKNGRWGTYRHLILPHEHCMTPHSDHVYGNIKQIGDLSSLKWLQGPLTKKSPELMIVYSSLNFKDVMQASGRLPIALFGKSRLGQTCIFGFEYSGINTSNGKRIMGMTFQGAVSSHIEKPPPLFWEVPANWSLREAATVPVVYLTVYYAFFYTADIRNGKSILIHAGSGGVGLAAIRVALAYGLQVFTTVSTADKKSFLLETFPSLKEKHIGNSRDTTFEDMIMEQTKGLGVDFVLNSLSEDKLKASVRCLGERGQFLEIGKFDMAKDNSIGLGSFLKELSFHAVLADNLLEADKTFVSLIKEHISNDIAKGVIQPLPSTVFLAHEIEDAFRYLMSGKHIGKILLQIRKDSNSNATLPIRVLPQIYFEPDLVYIVPGGLGGFGLELVDWMILRGARKIVLSSSRGISNDYQQSRILLWKSYSCEIVINTSDIGSEEGCLELLTESLELGSIGGIFNLAVILKDAIFSNQSRKLFQQSFKPKAFATKYLDKLSRKLCPGLDHFVVFSSVSCGRGNAGQSNYGMANSIMERIIEDRVAHGLPGKAIQWGAVGEVGLVAEMAAGKIDSEIGGTLQQRISSCIDVLDVLLSSPDPIVASMVVAEKKVRTAGQSPIEFVLNTLSIRDIKTISVNAPLAELGMDSLMSTEIKQTLECNFDIVLNNSDLRSLTIAKLSELSENFSSTKVKAKEVDNYEHIENMRQFYGQMANLGNPSTIFDHVNQVTNGKPIIILPGIDGRSGEIWLNIAKNLKSPTYVLQFDTNSAARSITEIVKFATENICEFLRTHQTMDFQIVAYSFGALVAHFTVAELEAKGYQGKLVLIDGSPFWLQTVISSLQKAYVGIELDKMALILALSIILPNLSVQTIERDFKNKLFKEEWFQYIYSNLFKYDYGHIDEMMTSIECIYQRLKIIQNPDTYKNTTAINTEVLVVKPTNGIIKNNDESYGISSLTINQTQTEILEGNHQSILQNEKLCDIINTYFNK